MLSLIPKGPPSIPACRLTTREADAIRHSGIPVHALTGSHDGITSAASVALLAGSLGALSMHSVHGGHAGGAGGWAVLRGSHQDACCL